MMVAGGARSSGAQLCAKINVTTIRPPQRGQQQGSGCCTAVSAADAACGFSSRGAMASRSRALAIAAARFCGDGMMRALLYEAAQVLLSRVKKWSWLKAWAMKIAKRRGRQKAIVALARRLAVVMHRMWSDGTQFRWTKENAQSPA